jgi:response regulator NasT
LENALIVSHSEKSADFFVEQLQGLQMKRTVVARSCGEGRRLLGQGFDLVLINGPLADEPGENFARHAATQGYGQVLLVVPCAHYEEIAAATEDFGVLTIPKPINMSQFWAALKLARASHRRLAALRAENTRLARKIEDIRIIHRAKCVLISYLNLTEPEAHKHIERQAMDLRVTKRAVAEDILKTYES